MAVLITDKLFLTKHLATLIKSGVPLDESLETVRDQATPELKKILDRVLEDSRSGKTLAEALGKYPRVFDKFFVSLVEAGEKSGNLEKNLIFLAEQMGKDYSLRQKVRGALMYPTFVLSATVIMGIGISWFVLPKLIDMFAGFEVELPLSTKILMSLALFVRDYGTRAILGLIGLVVTLILISQLRSVKKMWHIMAIKLPVAGKIVVYGEMGRLCRNLGVMLSSGMPIVESLTITAETLTNLKFVDDLRKVAKKVEEGNPLFEVMGRKKYTEFDKLSVKMVKVGEKSGNLEEMLLYLSDYYSEEIDSLSKNLSTLLEPVLLVVIGFVVGFVAYAIITPIYSLMGGIR